MNRHVLVGCCGFCISRQKYYTQYRVVEIQQTFYKIPSEATLLRWRNEAPEHFIFTMKAWQVITHPPTSPTWKKAGIEIDETLRDKYGLLRPTEENFEAWRRTIRAAEALRARVVVLQTPPSFGYSEENYKNVVEFFSSIDRPSNLIIAWEPRGSWHERPVVLRELAEKHDIVIAVDPLRRNPIVTGDVAYFRLHGLGGREVNYRYKYSDADLEKLARIIAELAGKTDSLKEVYVMFNNIYMREDSMRFKSIAEKVLKGLMSVY